MKQLNNENTVQKVYRCFEGLGAVQPFLKEVKKDTTFKELGLDSLDIIQGVLELEDKYNVQISDEQLDDFQSIGDIVDLLEAL